MSLEQYVGSGRAQELIPFWYLHDNNNQRFIPYTAQELNNKAVQSVMARKSALF